jgi:hypothetical protein
MALVRRTMENIRRLKPRINRAKIDATTEADIRRHMREEDQGETVLAGFAPVIPPQLLRRQLGMTQDEFARALTHSTIDVAQLGTGPGATGPSRSLPLDHRSQESQSRAQGPCRVGRIEPAVEPTYCQDRSRGRSAQARMLAYSAKQPAAARP